MDCFFQDLWDCWQNWNWSEVVVVTSIATLMKGDNFSNWLGTCPDRKDKLIIWAISAAASLSNPGGKLSNPVAFFRFNFFSSRSTNIVDTYPNWKVCRVLCFTAVGGFRINSRNLIADFFDEKLIELLAKTSLDCFCFQSEAIGDNQILHYVVSQYKSYVAVCIHSSDCCRLFYEIF